MNNTNFIQTGGWPLNLERLEELETSFNIFNAFGSLAGNLSIISGCETIGSTVQKGFVYIDGELLEFRPAVVSGASRVIIIEEAVSRPFQNGSVKQIYTIRYATFGTSDVSWSWTDFAKPIETKLIKGLLDGIAGTINAMNTRLLTAEAKLITIASGAQVNVQSDWNVTDVNSDAFIKNKIAMLSPFLRVSTFFIGNPAIDQKYTVNFPTVNTSNYLVVAGIKVNNSSQWDLSNDVIWTYGATTATSFELYLREIANQTQSVTLGYALIPL